MRRASTFEVIVESQGRSHIDGVFEAEKDARDRAYYLLGQAKYNAVRVSRVDGRGASVTIFEQSFKGGGKVVTVGQLDDAPLCDCVDDVFGYVARRALGRVMRPWCDEQTMLPLEVLHSAIQLRRIEREDVLFNQLINRLASVQAKKYRMDQGERADQLRKLYHEVFTLAKTADQDLAVWGRMIRRDGFNALIDTAHKDLAPFARDRAITFALSEWTGPSREWSGKLESLTELFNNDIRAEAVEVLDQAIAEILDSPNAIRGILGYAPDLGTALVGLAHLAKGSFDERHGRSPGFEKLNWIIDRWGMPHTRGILLARIARTLDGTTRLTKTGKAGDAQSFRKVVALLREVGGFKGGPDMCSALTRRAQTALGREEEDLPVEEAVSAVIDGLPDPATRIGYLLDLLASEFGHRRATHLTKRLANIFTRMTSMKDFFAGDPDAWKSTGIRDSFRERLYNGGIRRDLADMLLRRIEMLSKADEVEAARMAARAGAAAALPAPAVDEDVDKTVCLQIEALSEIPKVKGPQLMLYYQGNETVCAADIDEFTLGRGSECDIRVASKTASRRHAVVRCRQGEFTLADRSRNGTFVRMGGRSPMVLRNNTATLSGSGTIYLGADPYGEDVDKTHLILFQYVK